MHDTRADAQLEKPLTNVQYDANTPNAKRGRTISSASWEVIKRLKDVTLTGVKKEGQIQHNGHMSVSYAGGCYV